MKQTNLLHVHSQENELTIPFFYVNTVVNEICAVFLYVTQHLDKV